MFVRTCSSALWKGYLPHWRHSKMNLKIINRKCLWCDDCSNSKTAISHLTGKSWKYWETILCLDYYAISRCYKQIWIFESREWPSIELWVNAFAAKINFANLTSVRMAKWFEILAKWTQNRSHWKLFCSCVWSKNLQVEIIRNTQNRSHWKFFFILVCEVKTCRWE